MIVCVDANYRSDETVAAAVGIQNWDDAASCLERVMHVKQLPAPYIAGQFYLREMPAIVDLLATIRGITLIVVDGYVWLGKHRRGLGVHLYERFDAVYPVIGVAKRPFRNNDSALAVRRGGSACPLYVTAIGIELGQAATEIGRMHGPHRIPTILKRADRLARDAR